MKLVSFGPAGEERPGILDGSAIVWPGSLEPSLPGDWRGILKADRLGEVRELAASGRCESFSSGSVRLGPPITNPSKIVCLGLNYADHAREQNKEPPETPLLFAKAPSTLAGCSDPIRIPDGVTNVNVEAELAFVVGRRAKAVKPGAALGVIAGYMVLNDVSARRLQRDERQWFRAKSFDTFAPCGPYLLTSDEVTDPHKLWIRSELNGERLQDSSTSELIHRLPAIVAWVSGSMTLEPGDIVSTGTPCGVGVFRDPPLFIKPGDEVSVAVEGLGEARSRVEAGG